MSPYIGYDSDTTFIPGTLNTSSSLTIQGGGITQTGGDVNFDSGTLFIDEDLNRVGIGITTPGETLTVDSGTSVGQVIVSRFRGNASGVSGQVVNVLTSNLESGAELQAYSLSTTNNTGALLNLNDAIVLRTASTTSGGLAVTTASSTAPLIFATNSTERLRITSTGNVGIGTTNPTDKLHIYGGRLELDNALAGQTAIQFNQAGSEMAVLYRPGNVSNSIRMYVTGGGDVMSWTSAGNVGIGTNAPGTKLSVYGGSSIFQSSAGGSAVIIRDNSIENYNRDSDTSEIAVNYLGYNSTNTYFRNFTVYNGKTSTIAKFIGSTGNVGIGTTNPESKLTIAADSASAQIELKRTNSTSSGAYGAVNFTALDGHSVANIHALSSGNDDGAHLILKTTSAAGENNPYGSSTPERLRITSTGNVGIGTTNPSAKLQIEGIDGGNFGALLLKNNHSNGSSQGGVDINFDVVASNGDIARSRIRGLESTNDSPYSELAFFTSDTTALAPSERVRINKSGNVGINTTTPSEKLEIYGGDILLSNNAVGINNGTGPNNQIRFEYNGHNYARIVGNGRDSSGYGDIDFYTSSGDGVTNLEQRMTISAEGKIGIPAVAESSALLGIKGSSTSELTDSSGLYNQGNPCYLQIKNSTDSISDPECGIILQPRNSANGSVVIYAKRTGSYTSDLIYRVRTGSSTSAERLRIKNDGNVGIGTTSPASKLAVNGLITESTDNATSYHNVVTAQDIGTAPNQVPINAYLGTMAFQDSDSVVVGGLVTTGAVGIGTTNPSTKLHIANGGLVVNANDAYQVSSVRTLLVRGGRARNTSISNEENAIKIWPGEARNTTVGAYWGGISFNHLEPHTWASYGGSHLWIGGRFPQQGFPAQEYSDLVFATNGSSTQGSHAVERMCISYTGNVGIGTTNPAYKLQVEGSVFINNSDLNANRNIIKGTGSATAPSTRLDNYKTFTNGVYQNYFRFTRSNSAADNNKVGVTAGMLHIVYINDRSNAVQTTGYDCFPIVIRGRSADVMSGTVGSAIADVHNVIGSAIQVQFANATTTTIDLQIYIYNSDGGGDERLCHAWIDLGLAGTDTDRLVYPSVL